MSILLMAATSLLLAACDDSPEIAPSLYSISYDHCGGQNQLLKVSPPCKSFQVDIRKDGRFAMTSSFCEPTKPCTGKLTSLELAHLQQALAGLDLPALGQPVSPCANASDVTYFRISMAPQWQIFEIEHWSPCKDSSREAALQGFEDALLATFPPEHRASSPAPEASQAAMKLLRMALKADACPGYSECSCKPSYVGMLLDIDGKGRIVSGSITQSSGWKGLDNMTLQSIQNCRMHPAIYQNKPVSSQLKMIYIWKPKDN